jgi:hypothetical protein
MSRDEESAGEATPDVSGEKAGEGWERREGHTSPRPNQVTNTLPAEPGGRMFQTTRSDDQTTGTQDIKQTSVFLWSSIEAAGVAQSTLASVPDSPRPSSET